jgi:peptidoglycan DL-endopeptidase CwlO
MRGIVWRRRRTARPGVEPRRVKPLRLFAIAVAAVLLATLVPTADAATKELRLGSRGKAVRVLQQRLGLPADGVFGRRTVRAVKRFQRRHGIKVTGRVGDVTRGALGLTAKPVKPIRTGGAPADEDPADAGPVTAPAPTLPPLPASAASMVDAARAALGRPYAAGASGPEGFDCSGLIVWAGKTVGLDLPRSSFAQYALGTALGAADVQAGDLVFFDTAGPGASDVGIATSSTTAISATTHGVREHPIGGTYWGKHYVGARRLG